MNAPLIFAVGFTALCFAPAVYMSLAWFVPRHLRPTEGAREIARLLRADPRGWRVGRHTMQHLASQISIWHANDDYGLTYWVGSEDDHHKYRKEHFRAADRLCVWRAVKDMLGGRVSDIASRARASTDRAPLYMVPLARPAESPMRQI